jgi:hypothetical protein
MVFYAGALLLSLTHYFGLIYVFVIALINFFEQRIERARQRTMILLIAILLWPIWHVVAGEIANKTGGEFWIKVSPPVLGTITVFLAGSLPFLVDETSPFQHVAAICLLVAFVFVCIFRWRAIRSFLLADWRAPSAIADESRYVVLSVLMVVGTLSLTDLHTPMSTTRNYSVLLPAVIIALANSLTMLANLGGTKKASWLAALLLVVIITVLLAQQSWTKLTAKIQPHQNWKGLADYVRRSNVCSDGCYVIGSYGLHPFYFAGAGIIDDLSVPKAAAGVRARSVSLDEQVEFVSNLPDAKILGLHMASEKVIELMEVNQLRECIQPQQSWPNSTFLILPKQSLTGAEVKHGMGKCS